jgi:hypothetical protein
MTVLWAKGEDFLLLARNDAVAGGESTVGANFDSTVSGQHRSKDMCLESGSKCSG